MIIAIDGPAGSGKSSTAKEVAKRLNITYLDTGAMYRVVTLAALRRGISSKDNSELKKMLDELKISFVGRVPDVRVIMNGEDVTEEIRGEKVTAAVSEYCAPAIVRETMVLQQRQMGKNTSLVCEGRDIGTTVFPNAELKIFMTASLEARALRRKKDFEKIGINKSKEELMKELTERDRKDSTREISPFTRAKDAILLDTTNMNFEEQVEWIVEKAKIILKS